MHKNSKIQHSISSKIWSNIRKIYYTTLQMFDCTWPVSSANILLYNRIHPVPIWNHENMESLLPIGYFCKNSFFPEATISSSLALLNKQYIQKCYNKQIENGSLLNSQKYSGIYTNPNPLPFITVCFRIEVPYLVITELLYNQHVN